MNCQCGNPNIVIEGNDGNNRLCRNCGRRWYVNNCWNCKTNIDSRKGNNRCKTCGWYRCMICHRCSPSCGRVQPIDDDFQPLSPAQEVMVNRGVGLDSDTALFIDCCGAADDPMVVEQLIDFVEDLADRD